MDQNIVISDFRSSLVLLPLGSKGYFIELDLSLSLFGMAFVMKYIGFFFCWSSFLNVLFGWTLNGCRRLMLLMENKQDEQIPLVH